MGKLLDKYWDVIDKPTCLKSEYQKWKVYEFDQNLKEITIETDNKSVNSYFNFGYFLTTSVKTLRGCKFTFTIRI